MPLHHQHVGRACVWQGACRGNLEPHTSNFLVQQTTAKRVWACDVQRTMLRISRYVANPNFGVGKLLHLLNKMAGGSGPSANLPAPQRSCSFSLREASRTRRNLSRLQSLPSRLCPVSRASVPETACRHKTILLLANSTAPPATAAVLRYRDRVRVTSFLNHDSNPHAACIRTCLPFNRKLCVISCNPLSVGVMLINQATLGTDPHRVSHHSWEVHHAACSPQGHPKRSHMFKISLRFSKTGNSLLPTIGPSTQRRRMEGHLKS